MQDSIFEIVFEDTFWKILLHSPAHLYVCYCAM